MVASNLNLGVNKQNIREARTFRVILDLSPMPTLTNSYEFFLGVNPAEPPGAMALGHGLH